MIHWSSQTNFLLCFSNRLQEDKKYSMSDVELYTSTRSDTMLGEYAEQYWS